MAPYYTFNEDQFYRGYRPTMAPFPMMPRGPLGTIFAFTIAAIAGVFFGLIVVCAICRIGWFTRQEPEIIGLPDWSQVQWRRIRMRVPQLSTITDWESNPGSPDNNRSIDDDDESATAPLLPSP